jgi:hypothetical protein
LKNPFIEITTGNANRRFTIAFNRANHTRGAILSEKTSDGTVPAFDTSTAGAIDTISVRSQPANFIYPIAGYSALTIRAAGALFLYAGLSVLAGCAAGAGKLGIQRTIMKVVHTVKPVASQECGNRKQ